MSRAVRMVILAGALFLVSGSGVSATACPMCKVAHEDSDDAAVQARPRAYMYSILFMLAMPASLLTAFGVGFYRLTRQPLPQTVRFDVDDDDDDMSAG